MSSTMLAVLGVIAVVIVILLVVVVSMLNKGSSSSSSSSSTSSSSTGKLKVDGAGGNLGAHVTMPNIMALSLPEPIEKLTKNQVHDISKKVYETYRILDYKSMDMFALDKKEWHTWQVSILLKMFKQNEEFFISNPQDVFHDFLLSANDNDMKSLMRSIIKKYENYVNIHHTKDTLSREYIWSNKDVSTIFYFLANYKNYKS